MPGGDGAAAQDFGSGVTLYETIHTGTPVVTLEGHFLRSRFVAAAYRLMEVEDPPVAASPEAYVELAVALMQDPQRRELLRQEIAAKRKPASMTDSTMCGASRTSPSRPCHKPGATRVGGAEGQPLPARQRCGPEARWRFRAPESLRSPRGWPRAACARCPS